MMKLRDYQRRAVSAILSHLKESKSTLMVAATGTGKTVIAAHLISALSNDASFALNGRRALFVAHREELLNQAAEKIKTITGQAPGLELAESWSDERSLLGKPDVVLASVQTLNSGRLMKRMERFKPEEFGLIVFDEAHHAVAETYRRVVDHFRQNCAARIMGMTATADRGDEEALGQIFDTVAFEYDVLQAVNDGWLVPIEQQYISIAGLDYSGIKTTAGDLNSGELANVMQYEKTLHGVAYATMQEAGDRKALVFASSVAHAERLAEIFNRHKPRSAFVIHGKTDKQDRRHLLSAYKNGAHQFFVNVGVATEGFDAPDAEVVVMARPTKSRSLYTQMLGRGTRPLPGIVDVPGASAADRRERIANSNKPCVTVLDFVGNSGRHKLISAVDVLGGNVSDRVAQVAHDRIQKSGRPSDVLDEIKQAEREEKERLAKEREEAAKRSALKAKAEYKKRPVDPFAILDVMPHREAGWNKGKSPTPKQIILLERFGVDAAQDLTRNEASQMIDEIIGRREKGLCTFKQAKLLKQYGYGDSSEYSFEYANGLITKLKQNGWRSLKGKDRPKVANRPRKRPPTMADVNF